MGLANNKVRFTILPKPCMHVPDIAAGEPPWRFKRMLFDAEGNYSQAGMYTIEEPEDENSKKTLSYLDGAVTIDPKSGNVTVTNKQKVRENMFECYPGLTVYEFNYEYVMGMKLFDAKVITSTLVETLFNTNIGVGANIWAKHNEGAEKVKEIIRHITQADDGEKNECYFTFDNSKYDVMLEAARKKRANRGHFGRTSNDIGVFDSVYEILKEYDNPSNSMSDKHEILTRALTEASVVVNGGEDGSLEYGADFDFVTDLIDNLILALMEAVLSPKVMLLLEVNQRLMGGTWKMFDFEDVLKAMTDVINSIVKELRDLIIQELLKFLESQLGAIREMFTSMLFREKLEEYATIIDRILRDCPIMWFKFGNEELDTKLDTVDYADIVVAETKVGDRPNNNKC